MNKDYAAQLLIEASRGEPDPQLQLALLMGARELKKDGIGWMPEDLQKWMYPEELLPGLDL